MPIVFKANSKVFILILLKRIFGDTITCVFLFLFVGTKWKENKISIILNNRYFICDKIIIMILNIQCFKNIFCCVNTKSHYTQK